MGGAATVVRQTEGGGLGQTEVTGGGHTGVLAASPCGTLRRVILSR